MTGFVDCCTSFRSVKLADVWLRSVALITGAGSGIGRATANVFAEEGVTRLVLADINLASVESLASELKKENPSIQALALKIDTSSESDTQNMVDEAVKAFGAIHYCVNAAGITSSSRLRTHELTAKDFDRIQNVNLRGVWLCLRAEITQMLKQNVDLKMRYKHIPQACNTFAH